MFVDVAFPISQYQVFTYKIPKQFSNLVSVGVRVRAPMGKRVLPGIIVKITKDTSFSGKIKSISEVIDDTPIGNQTGAIHGRGIRKRTSIVVKLGGHLIKR